MRVIEDRWHVFSRSCAIGAGAQESITYALMLSRWLYVRSEHYNADDDGHMRWLHNVETPTDGPKGPGWHFGWRGRAGDFGNFGPDTSPVSIGGSSDIRDKST